MKASNRQKMQKGVFPKKNKRTKTVLMAFILAMLMTFLSGCTADDFNILRFLDGNVGIPQVEPDVNIDIPDALDFEYGISQELLDYLQSLDSLDIESITSIEDIRLMLRSVNADIDVDLEQLLRAINNMNAPTVPVADSDAYIYVTLYITCSRLENFDTTLYGTASTDGLILDMPTLPVRANSTINEVMSNLAEYAGTSIPVTIDGGGTITSINDVANDTREHLTEHVNYNCYWRCSVNDESLLTGTQNYQLQSGDVIFIYYQCDEA